MRIDRRKKWKGKGKSGKKGDPVTASNDVAPASRSESRGSSAPAGPPQSRGGGDPINAEDGSPPSKPADQDDPDEADNNNPDNQSPVPMDVDWEAAPAREPDQSDHSPKREELDQGGDNSAAGSDLEEPRLPIPRINIPRRTGNGVLRVPKVCIPIDISDVLDPGRKGSTRNSKSAEIRSEAMRSNWAYRCPKCDFCASVVEETVLEEASGTNKPDLPGNWAKRIQEHHKVCKDEIELPPAPPDRLFQKVTQSFFSSRIGVRNSNKWCLPPAAADDEEEEEDFQLSFECRCCGLHAVDLNDHIKACTGALGEEAACVERRDWVTIGTQNIGGRGGSGAADGRKPKEFRKRWNEIIHLIRRHDVIGLQETENLNDDNFEEIRQKCPGCDHLKGARVVNFARKEFGAKLRCHTESSQGVMENPSITLKAVNPPVRVDNLHRHPTNFPRDPKELLAVPDHIGTTGDVNLSS